MTLPWEKTEGLSWREKTEKLKDRFDQRNKTIKRVCQTGKNQQGVDKCGNEIFTQRIWTEFIKPQIDYCKENDFTHPYDQIENTKELFYIECPECGEGEYVPKS